MVSEVCNSEVNVPQKCNQERDRELYYFVDEILSLVVIGKFISHFIWKPTQLGVSYDIE